MNEKNRTHAKLALNLASGLAQSLDVADTTGTVGELKPMVIRAKERLLACDYRDEEDFREARLKATDIHDVLVCDGYTGWVRAETRDLIRDLRKIYYSFFE